MEPVWECGCVSLPVTVCKGLFITMFDGGPLPTSSIATDNEITWDVRMYSSAS